MHNKIKTYFKLLFAYSHFRKDALTKWRLGSIINYLTCEFVTQYRLYFVTWYTLWSWASLCLSYSYITTFQKDVFFSISQFCFLLMKKFTFSSKILWVLSRNKKQVRPICDLHKDDNWQQVLENISAVLYMFAFSKIFVFSFP